jgi:hypothetical protein
MSLTLSNSEQTLNQIDLFLSLFHLRQVTRLRSLTLFYINEDQLDFILKGINLKTLTSLSCHITNYDGKRKNRIKPIHLSIVTPSALHKLEIDTSSKMPKIVWPVYSITEYLFPTNRIDINDLCKILEYSPNLHILILSEIPTGSINKITSIYFRQLKSLSVANISVRINEVEMFLLLTPSLVYLKLIGGEKILNGKRWEEFIQINLPYLDKFEFYFNALRSTRQSLTDLQLIIDSFQTPFWIEHKKWFIAWKYQYDYGIPSINIISLYSIPICTSHFDYTSKSGKTSLFNYLTMIDNDTTTMENIKSLHLILDKSTADDINERVKHFQNNNR